MEMRKKMGLRITVTAILLFCLQLPTLSGQILSDREIEFLKHNPVITFTGQKKYPPFEFINKNKDYTGMSVELIHWIAVEMGFKAKFLPLSFQEAQQAVLNGTADVIISLFYSKTRDENFDFTRVLFQVPASIFIRSERTDISATEDLPGKTIAMQRGDYAEEFLKNKGIAVSYKPVESFHAALFQVLSNTADAVIGDEQPVLHSIYSYKLNTSFKKVGKPLYIGQNCMAVKEQNTILLSILNKGILQAERKGIINKIYRKWLGVQYLPGSSALREILPVAAAAFFLLLLMVAGVWYWNFKLRREVHKQTKKLREAYQSIRSSDEKFRLIRDNTSDLINITDVNGVFRYASPSYERILGYREKELLGKNIRDFLPSDDIPAYEVFFSESHFEQMSFRDNIELEYHFLDKDRRYHDLSCTMNYVTDNNRDRLIISVCKDVTEKNHIQQELLKARKLESVSTLAGGIAHDFNNLLTAIMGNISLCKFIAEPESEINRRLQEAETATIRARDLTKQLLTFSRGGAPVKTITDIARLLRETSGFSLSGTNVEAKLDIDAKLWAAEVDQGQLTQVFNNLLVNAAQAMNTGGTVHISAHNHWINQNDLRPLKPGAYLEIVFRDNGPGIESKLLKKIFDPYFSTKPSGNGLGLASAYSIINRHSGIIEAESEPGHGALFRILLPASDRTPELPFNENSIGFEHDRNNLVLIMDDEDAVRQTLSDMLDQLGFRCLSVNDGAAFLSAYRELASIEEPPVLSILDLTVPGGMGGEETVKKLLIEYPDAKVVVSSGYSGGPVVSKYREFGFTGYLLKPYNMNDLAGVLKKVLT